MHCAVILAILSDGGFASQKLKLLVLKRAVLGSAVIHHEMTITYKRAENCRE